MTFGRCAALVLLLVSAEVGALAQVHLVASLGGAQEVPPVTTSASGIGSFQLNDDFTELRYTVSYQGLSGPLTAGGHFHLGTPGRTGSVIKGIAVTGDPATGTVTGTWKSSDATQPLTPALVESLLTGRVYVNFHTSANPSGEIRGQVELATALHFTIDLDSAQARPAVGTTGGGTGVLVLSTDRSEAEYWVTYRGLTGPLSAGGHVHVGAPGVSGPVVKGIASGGDPASGRVKGSWRSSDGTQPLTPALVDSLIAGKLYVNFHTANNPAGEIRGQLVLAGGTAFAMDLEGSKEVPPVTTGNGKGTGYLVLNSTRTEARYAVTYVDLSGTLTAGGHFHVGGPGRTGGVVKAIASSGGPASATVSGLWSSSDATQPLTVALAESLHAGKVYVNFHTSANPSGEIRGQVDLTTGIGWTVTLDGSEEVPPLSVAGKGTGYVVLNAERQDVRYGFTYHGLTGTLTAGGHFHTGARGATGPVAKAIAFSGGPAAATVEDNWSSGDATQSLTEALVDSILAGRTYVNFHTSAHGSGEIRGQVAFPSATTTSVEQTSTEVPASFALEQNYPNPFNPSTLISFQLARAGRVDLRVYNLLGEEVRTLIADLKEPGSYSVRFDGDKLSSGVYLYRLVSDAGFSAVRKMMLVK
jgi:hypothetical protein